MSGELVFGGTQLCHHGQLAAACSVSGQCKIDMLKRELAAATARAEKAERLTIRYADGKVIAGVASDMDMTRDKIESEILEWDRRRAEAVRLHNACVHSEPEMRDILWRWVKVYESFIGSLRKCLSIHLANNSSATSRETPGQNGAASLVRSDALLDEIQASSDLAWEHAQQQQAIGNIVRSEWFKERTVALDEVVQRLYKANITSATSREHRDRMAQRARRADHGQAG